jgi:hypothetical protein
MLKCDGCSGEQQEGEEAMINMVRVTYTLRRVTYSRIVTRPLAKAIVAELQRSYPTLDITVEDLPR